MIFGFFNSKYKQESAKVFDSALERAKNSFPKVFNKESETKEERELKFEAISVYMSLYIWSLQKIDAGKLLERVYEEMYDRYDIAIREQGVSDVRVGPTIRALAAKFRNRLDVYGDSFSTGETKKLLEELNEKQLCDTQTAVKLSIELEAEAKMLKELSLKDWLKHLKNPKTGLYEPHEGKVDDE